MSGADAIPTETQQDEERHAGVVREATDLCWKATPYALDESGSIASYLLPAGVVHRLLGQLQGAGYSAAFRQTADIAARPSADTETLRARVEEVREQLSQRVRRYRHRHAAHSNAGRADLAHVTQMVADAYADALHLLAAVDGGR